jgi:hypothetical protein
VDLLIDKFTNSFNGTAIVSVDEGTVLSEVVSTLNGEDCFGRTIKVFEHKRSVNQNSLLLSSSRYYEGIDISFKCNSCGKVGHRQADCLSEAATPLCHLCAGSHEACKLMLTILILIFSFFLQLIVKILCVSDAILLVIIPKSVPMKRNTKSLRFAATAESSITVTFVPLRRLQFHSETKLMMTKTTIQMMVTGREKPVLTPAYSKKLRE